MTDARPIVVGYDGRGGSQAALERALDLAGPLGAPLVIVFSYEASRLGGEVADLDEAIAAHGSQVLEDALRRASGAGVPVETEQRAQPSAEGLVAAAEEHDAQMLVVGSTGEGPLRGMLIGSTPYKLLHLSERPVLVVRAG
jgi:nucleotide-binding universal stress UspA family protein